MYKMKNEKGRSCYHCKNYGCVLMSLRPLAKRTFDQKNLFWSPLVPPIHAVLLNAFAMLNK